jgi:tetratricopeptide (TPR) repeat protein
MMDEFVLARAAEALEKQFAAQPLVRAQLHLAIGTMYQQLGLYSAGESHLRAALEIRLGQYGRQPRPEVAECFHLLATILLEAGTYREAELLFQDALGLWRQLGGHDLQVLSSLAGLGQAIGQQGRLDEAERVVNQALQLARQVLNDDHPTVVGLQGNLGAVLAKQGRAAESEALNRRVLEWRQQHLGASHPEVAFAMFNLAQCISLQGRHAEAEPLLREALAIRRAAYGDEHPRVAKDRYNLAWLLSDLDRPAEAETLYRQALAQQRTLLGDSNPDVRQTLGALARLRAQAGDHNEAIALLREALAIAEQLYPDGHPEVWRRYSALNQLGGTLANEARTLLDADRQHALALFSEAESLILTSLDRLKDAPNMSGRRQSLESTARLFEFWHTVDPDRGWRDRAAELRAQAESLPIP